MTTSTKIATFCGEQNMAQKYSIRFPVSFMVDIKFDWVCVRDGL